MKKPKEKTGDFVFEGIADFLFEAGMLAHTPRSGFPHVALGTHKQNDAEHTCRTSFIGFSLAFMMGANIGKVIEMCLFHDLSEARISDLNYLSQKYFRDKSLAEKRARMDLAKTVPFGKRMLCLLKEFEKGETLEAQIARDADQIELLLSLKEMIDIGNERARSWIPSLLQRLKTEESVRLANAILETDFDHWWFRDKKDKHWVNPTNKK